MKDQFKKIASHFVDHRWTYISGAGLVLAGAAVGFMLGQDGYQKIELLNIKVNSPDNSQTTVILNRRGTLSNFVRDLDTGAIYESQNLAAKALSVGPSTISQHLRGHKPHAGGHRLEIVGEQA